MHGRSGFCGGAPKAGRPTLPVGGCHRLDPCVRGSGFRLVRFDPGSALESDEAPLAGLAASVGGGADTGVEVWAARSSREPRGAVDSDNGAARSRMALPQVPGCKPAPAGPEVVVRGRVPGSAPGNKGTAP